MAKKFYTIEDRQQIEAMIKNGFTRAQIAKALDRTYISIVREVERGKDDRGNYNAYFVHEKMRIRASREKNHGFIEDDQKKELREMIEQKIPVAKIANHFNVAESSIYYWKRKFKQKKEDQLSFIHPLHVSNEPVTYLSDDGVVESMIRKANMITGTVSLEFPKAIL